MTLDQRQELLNYLAEYNNNILKFNADGSRVEISTDVQLKHLLYGIDERYYTTALEKRKGWQQCSTYLICQQTN